MRKFCNDVLAQKLQKALQQLQPQDDEDAILKDLVDSIWHLLEVGQAVAIPYSVLNELDEATRTILYNAGISLSFLWVDARCLEQGESYFRCRQYKLYYKPVIVTCKGQTFFVSKVYAASRA